MTEGIVVVALQPGSWQQALVEVEGSNPPR